MTKPASNWANRTKETLATTPIIIPTGMKVQGLGERILAFYRFTVPQTPSESSRVLTAGSTFEGTYEGKFESTNYPGNFTYRIRTTEGLIGLPNCKQLSDDLGNLPEGTKVFVAYKGTESVKKGKYAGKQRHAFIVAADVQNNEEAV